MTRATELGVPLPSSSPEHALCVDFLVGEAAALDDNRFDDWLAMLHPDIDYRIPIRVTRERSAGPGFSEDGYHMYEDHDSLRTRVARLATEYAWAEDPPSRVRRFVTNHGVYVVEGSTDLRVRSSLLLFRERLDEVHPQLISAERRDLLRPVGERLKLVERRVLFDHAALGTHNLSIFF